MFLNILKKIGSLILFMLSLSVNSSTEPYGNDKGSVFRYLNEAEFIGVVLKTGGPLSWSEFDKKLTAWIDKELSYQDKRRIWLKSRKTQLDSFIILKSFKDDYSVGDLIYSQYQGSSSFDKGIGETTGIVLFRGLLKDSKKGIFHEECGFFFEDRLLAALKNQPIKDGELKRYFYENKLLPCMNE